MSKFKVGQRVRVRYACNTHNKWAVGQEACVVEVFRMSRTWYRLDIDDLSIWEAWTEDQLEPATYDGAAPSEFTTLRDLLNSLEAVHA
jgi:hypothetical protein